jgi:hypothetical protein
MFTILPFTTVCPEAEFPEALPLAANFTLAFISMPFASTLKLQRMFKNYVLLAFHCDPV